MSSMSEDRFYNEELKKLASELEESKRMNCKYKEYIEILEHEIQRGGKED